jgi:hypothetical protein
MEIYLKQRTYGSPYLSLLYLIFFNKLIKYNVFRTPFQSVIKYFYSKQCNIVIKKFIEFIEFIFFITL